MDTNISIYALVDPNTGDIRYIGKSEDPAKRLHEHISDAFSSQDKRLWIRNLITNGSRPVITILETCSSDCSQERERAWIARFGADLLNIANIPILPEFDRKTPAKRLTRSLADVERQYIEKIVRECGGNKVKAAKLLRIGRQTLYNKLAAFDPEDDDAKLRRILDI